MDERKALKHPIQPIGKDDSGTVRFKENKLVSLLLEQGPFDLNQLIALSMAEGLEDDYGQLLQLIGYSVSGIPRQTMSEYAAFDAMTETGADPRDARIAALEQMLADYRRLLRPAIASIFAIHPDDLEDDQ